mgnify:CR=1 FL=1
MSVSKNWKRRSGKCTRSILSWGSQKVLKESVSLAQKVSVTDVPVLLTGETGTGKEVFAQAIHYNSKRSKQNFVAVNCSSFSKELLESEMFGHKAGFVYRCVER